MPVIQFQPDIELDAQLCYAAVTCKHDLEAFRKAAAELGIADADEGILRGAWLWQMPHEYQQAVRQRFAEMFHQPS